LAAEMAEKGKVGLLYCDELDDPPELIVQAFSCVLGDIFHAMFRTKVPVKHEYKKAYYVALMNAFLSWDQNRLNEVKEKLAGNGWSDDDINRTLYFQSSFFCSRVERIALPPKQLYWHVRAVFVTFGNKLDSKTGHCLFNNAAWAKANNILKEILLGFYSDPPGFTFYQLQLDLCGTTKTDKYGLHLIHCSRGTNDVENIHKHYHTTFRYVAGIELGDCLLAERRHRHNLRMAETRILDHPRLGHFNTWQIDKLQILVEKNHGVLLFPRWINASDFRDTDESFVTVAIHSEELDMALKARAAQIDDEVKNSFSSDLRFLCRQQGVELPFLPMNGPKEYRLFTYLLLLVHEHFDENEMALTWIEYVNGVDIFPKHPHQLRKYHKQWEHNRRVQNAVENMKSDLDMLEALNKEHIPSELAAASILDDTEDVMILNEDDGVTPTGLLCFPRATMPAPMELPTAQAFRPADELGSLYVGMERIGDNVYPIGLPNLPRHQGMHGQDKKPHKKRCCVLCTKYGSIVTSQTCKGRNQRKACEHFHEDGKVKNH
jgi:hypothetical protein